MSDTILDPYVFFPGNAKEAMEFYKAIFGGELVTQTYGEVGMTDKEELKDKLIHARLEGGEVKLLASDSSLPKPTEGSRIDLAISGSDEAKLRRIFDQLCDGGQATHPLKKEFWGDTFGTLTDRYGINWMINITETNNS